MSFADLVGGERWIKNTDQGLGPSKCSVTVTLFFFFPFLHHTQLKQNMEKGKYPPELNYEEDKHTLFLMFIM